jgi:pimeloyl-ACP methyl ester carboxylesterase
MAPPVLLLHGLATSPDRTWRETGLIDLLADAGREVLTPTLPGHGAGASQDSAAYEPLLDQVLASFPDAVCDVVGFSLGGQLALRVAMAEPDRIRRLIVAGVGENLFRQDDPSRLIGALRSGDAGDDVFSGHFLQLATGSGNDPLALAALLDRARSAPLQPADLASVTHPTLVLVGDHDFVGPIDRLVEALPDGRGVVLPGVDHFQTPKAFAFIDAVLDFLDAAPS